MKRLFALLLAAVMVFAIAGCESDEQGAVGGERDINAPYGTLTYGSTTFTQGDFMGGWSNNTSDAVVKTLIHGELSILGLTPFQQYVINPVVTKNLDTQMNEDGTKTYTMDINEGLMYNDGTPITAADFVFSILLYGSPEFGMLDATNSGGIRYVGFKEYNDPDDEINYFTGVRLLGPYKFSITIAAENLPYYYDIGYCDIGPDAMHVIAPGCTVKDDGQGAYIDGPFTVELLTKTILDSETGYRYNPKVTCGPYQLVSFDKSSMITVLDLNPNYPGTYDGIQPRIQRIITKYVTPETQINELESGDVDILSGIGGKQYIIPGLELVDRGIVTNVTYDRNGYGMLRIHCDQSPTQFVEVRQAMMWLLDRDDFVRQYSGGYGIVVDSEYSKAQSVYQNNKEWLEENLVHYTYNPIKAVEVLEAGGWTLNAAGGKFTPGTDDVRYKMVDGQLMRLQIEWLSSGNAVADLVRVMLVPEAEKVGMIVNETVVANVLADASRLNSRDEDAKYFMFNMAVGFAIFHSPWTSYSDLPVYWGGNYNNNFLIDSELVRITEAMRLTDPLDPDAFEALHLQLLVRLNELVPNIPLYSDTYFDFFIPELKNYYPNSSYGFYYAITRAYLD